MLSKNYGEVQTDSEVKTTKALMEFMLHESSVPEQHIHEIRRKLEEMFPVPEQYNSQKFLHHIQAQAGFWRGTNAFRTSPPWINYAGEITRKYYLEEDPEEEAHNDQLLFKNEEYKLLQCIGELKLDECDALKTAVVSNGDQVYVDIRNWSKVENSEPWTQDEGGLVLDPAELLVLAQHINQAIHFIFSRTVGA